jgi:hypothetical protein
VTTKVGSPSPAVVWETISIPRHVLRLGGCRQFAGREGRGSPGTGGAATNSVSSGGVDASRRAGPPAGWPLNVPSDRSRPLRLGRADRMEVHDRRQGRCLSTPFREQWQAPPALCDAGHVSALKCSSAWLEPPAEPRRLGGVGLRESDPQRLPAAK